MQPEPGRRVRFLYTDAQGEHRTWRGEVRKVRDFTFSLETEEGYRTFRFDRVDGEIEPAS